MCFTVDPWSLGLKAGPVLSCFVFVVVVVVSKPRTLPKDRCPFQPRGHCENCLQALVFNL